MARCLELDGICGKVELKSTLTHDQSASSIFRQDWCVVEAFTAGRYLRDYAEIDLRRNDGRVFACERTKHGRMVVA